MDYTEISVDPKFHRHLIGKGGVNSKYNKYLGRCIKLLHCYKTESVSFSIVSVSLLINSQPDQRTAQGDCADPPRQWEKQPDPYRGRSPGCARSQEGAAWARVTHGEYSTHRKDTINPVLTPLLNIWCLAGEWAYKGHDYWTTFS